MTNLLKIKSLDTVLDYVWTLQRVIDCEVHVFRFWHRYSSILANKTQDCDIAIKPGLPVPPWHSQYHTNRIFRKISDCYANHSIVAAASQTLDDELLGRLRRLR